MCLDYLQVSFLAWETPSSVPSESMAADAQAKTQGIPGGSQVLGKSVFETPPVKWLSRVFIYNWNDQQITECLKLESISSVKDLFSCDARDGTVRHSLK